ncbi:MAG: universal stress protein [Pirellulales bacterium]
MIKRILVALGGTRYTPFAVSRAIELAQEHQAEVTGVTVVDVRRLSRVGPVPLGASASARELREFRVQVAREQVAQAEDEFTSACRQAGVPYQMRHEEGNSFESMAACARYHDLMIFGLRSLFEYDFEYDVVHDPHDSLIRLVTAGVRPMLAIAPDSRPIRRVLIAYSGSMESAKTIKWFVQLGLWPKAQLRIVTFEHQVDEAEQLVGDAADYCRAHGLEPEEAYVPDSPKDHLLPYAAEWGADLIVAGNSAKNLLLRHVFGETALNLITSADRPLFLAQ